MRPHDGPAADTHADPAPRCQAIEADTLLAKQIIVLELDRVKTNSNKNPIIAKAVLELEILDRLNGFVSTATLAIVIAQLNFLIRSRGLTARETWTSQFPHEQIPMDDVKLIMEQQSEPITTSTLKEKIPFSASSSTLLTYLWVS